MPKIRGIVETEDSQSTEQIFVLPGNLDTLDAIDEAVEQFKNETLPRIEQELLPNSQECLGAQEKKTGSDPESRPTPRHRCLCPAPQRRRRAVLL